MRKILTLISAIVSLSVGCYLLQANGNEITPEAPLMLEIDEIEAVTLEFETEVGKVYRVEISETLDGDWRSTTPSLHGTGSKLSQLVPTGGLETAFFRLRDDGDPSGLVAATPVRKWVDHTDEIVSQSSVNSLPNDYQNRLPYEIELSVSLAVRFVGENARVVLETSDDGVEWIQIDQCHEKKSPSSGTINLSVRASIPSQNLVRVRMISGELINYLWVELR